MIFFKPSEKSINKTDIVQVLKMLFRNKTFIEIFGIELEFFVCSVVERRVMLNHILVILT